MDVFDYSSHSDDNSDDSRDMEELKASIQKFIDMSNSGELVSSELTCNECNYTWTTPLNVEGATPVFECPKCGSEDVN